MREKLNKIISGIRYHPMLKKILDWSKEYYLPGFSKVPIYAILSFIWLESQRDAITTRASSIAFNLFLAIFPGIIFIFTLIPLMPFSDYYNTIIENSLQNALPQNASSYLLGVIQGITEIKRGGLLSLGFMLSAFFSSNGMLTLMFGFDKSYDLTFKKRNYFKQRLVAVFLTMILIFLFIISVLFIVIGDEILSFLFDLIHLKEVGLVFTIFRLLIGVAIIYSGITIIYRYGPSMHKRISFWSPGAMLATLLSIITSLGFSFFINNFGRYNEIYGSIGALIVIMIWLQLNAFILLIGFELNASIAVNRDLLADRDKGG